MNDLIDLKKASYPDLKDQRVAEGDERRGHVLTAGTGSPLAGLQEKAALPGLVKQLPSNSANSET